MESSTSKILKCFARRNEKKCNYISSSVPQENNDQSIITLEESWKLPQHQRWRWNDKQGCQEVSSQAPWLEVKNSRHRQSQAGEQSCQAPQILLRTQQRMDRREGQGGEEKVEMLNTYKFNSYH